MQILKLMIVLLLGSISGACVQPEDHFVVLPTRAAKSIPSEGFWQPTKEQISAAESSLSQISRLSAEGWSPAIHIDHPERYFRQYLPIVRAGKNILYTNAFCDEESLTYWRTKLVVVSDGATCFWQALYDPVTKTYSHLRINARA